MTAPFEPTEPTPDPSSEDPSAEAQRRISAETDEFEELAETAQDEYDRAADTDTGELSIDDALESDRVRDELPESRNVDGYGFDQVRDRGLDESAAADQGNRDKDEMITDGDPDLEAAQLAGSDPVGTDPDFTGATDDEGDAPLL